MGGMRRPTIDRRDRARSLRRNAIEAEKRLWWHLRHRLPLEGTDYRRQVPLGPYFADRRGPHIPYMRFIVGLIVTSLRHTPGGRVAMNRIRAPRSSG
jgi:very-short-patch-repair endonuclease